MAEVLSSLVRPVMEELGRFTLVKIKYLFTYLCCFNSNIQSLRDEAQKLEDARSGLQRDVIAAENNAEVILPEVKTWLENASDKIQVDKRGIDDEIPTVKNGCWSVKSRYRISKNAVKITREMKQLKEDRNRFNNHISTPPLPAAQAEIPLRTTYEFNSRKQIEEDIMNALKAKEVTTMGICGMGGVGKTTMAKRIMARVKKENIFQEIFMVVISQQADMLKIQDEIAEPLGLTLGEKTLSARANKIHARLMSTKRTLIVFDDVWERLKLEDLGIPCGNEQCRILLTSRNKDVLKEMDAKVYGVEILSNTEAWFLFREKTGSCVDHPNLFSTARKIAGECNGLPIALITVGGALKDQTGITFWEDALQQLKSFNPEDMPSVIKDVYNPLKLSYTKLESRHAKSLFLLCSLFPEDDDISLEELTSYCIGLQMFSNLDISNASERILEKVRRRVFTIVDMLKNRFLLLEGWDEHHVGMHDVVRDVAMYIASHEAKEGMFVDVKINSMCLSSEYTYHLCSVFSEKKSSLLRMHGSSWREKFELKDFYIFERIEQLSLLSFQYIIMKSIPLEIQVLKNLRTLRIEFCELEHFSVVGELLSLEVLCCRSCSGIEELPVEIGNLNQLKLLDFTHCRSLKRIPPGVISNLVELEEFKMLHSFGGWELTATTTKVQGQEGRNARLDEFENLFKLTCLEIEIKDINLASEEISFPPNIVRYHLGIGDIFSYRRLDTSPNAKGMCMKLPGDISLGSWVIRFLKSANQLYLVGDGSSPLDLRQSHSMKSLILDNCSTVKKLVNSTTSSILNLSEFDVFPILEDLSLSRLPNLEEIYDGTVLDQSNSFRNLKELYLANLPALKHLWKRSNRSIVSLHNLRKITIEKCNKLDSLFSFTNGNGTDQISTAPTKVDELLCTQTAFFPMLEEMELRGLDKLEVIWNSSIPEGSTSFNYLSSVSLLDLPALTHLWKSPNLSVSFNSLSQIQIYKCHKLRNIFSSTMMSVNFFLQLTNFKIENCEMMEQVVLNENDENQCRTIRFPKLLELELNSLKSLTAFGKGMESIEFPVLEKMIVTDCPKLTSFLSSDLSNQNSANDHDKYVFHLFCNQKISFGSLKAINISIQPKCNIWCRQILVGFFRQLEKLEINICIDLRSLFSTSIAENFINLEKLEIRWCNEMVKVIEDDEEMSFCEKSHTLFPSLKDLKLEMLPKLKNFCDWRCDFLQLPSLVKVEICDCPLLQFFTMKFVTTPKLEKVIINKIEKEVEDLNRAIQVHFETIQCRQLISSQQT